MSIVKDLKEILVPGENLPSQDWNLKVVMNGDCQAYIASNNNSREAILIDPMVEEVSFFEGLKREFKDYLWLCVIDSHTHADHVSGAAHLAEFLGAPLVMHADSPSKRVHIRIMKTTSIPAHAAPIRFISTPGHTPDALCIHWGPFLFTGDTVLFNDVGRDDLPGGSPELHYESLERLKDFVSPDLLVCPGHDFKGGRISSWKAQMHDNSSLTQDADSYIREAKEFDAPAPKLLKKSLAENFR